MENKERVIYRFFIVYLAMVGFALWIVARCLFMWFAEGDELRSKAENIIEKKCSFPAIRGGIYAQDGRILAVSIPQYLIRMDFRADGLKKENFDRDVDSLSICLAGLFKDRTAREYKRFLMDYKYHKRRNRYVLISSKKLSYPELMQLKQFPLFRLGRNKSGLICERQSFRKQPHENLAARTIGYLSMNKNSKKIGRVGLEGAFNSELEGKEGTGVNRKIPGGYVPVRLSEPKDGNDVITTINIDYQDVAESALLEQLEKYNADHGCAVLMEVKTGAIRAIANLGFDKYKQRYVENYNYAIGEATEPGSTFKLPSVMALLEDGYVDPLDTVNTGRGVMQYYGVKMTDCRRGGFGKITLQQVFEKSSNIGVSKMVNSYYKKNPEAFIDRLYSFRLNKKLGIEIAGEAQPVIKYPTDKSWSGLSLPWMSIGYELRLTPLQTLTFYNAVANDGEMVKPRLVEQIEYHGKVLKEYGTEILQANICSESTLKSVKKMLEGVVLHGTATNIKNNNYSIAGKTGTAQVAQGSKGYNKQDKVYQASFVGYFPADNPLFSCIVVINQPDKTKGFYGNKVAGSVFKTIADKVYAKSYQMHPNKQAKINHKAPISTNGNREDLTTVFNTIDVNVNNAGIDADWVLTSRRDTTVKYLTRKISRKVVPNVKGMSSKDAIFLLENAGLKVSVRGIGVVDKQSIIPGKRIKRGDKITISLS